jgi:hypothetical protein
MRRMSIAENRLRTNCPLFGNLDFYVRTIAFCMKQIAGRLRKEEEKDYRIQRVAESGVTMTSQIS